MNTKMKYFKNSIILRIPNILLLLGTSSLVFSCNNNEQEADAYGNFEVEETTISAQASGVLLQFDVEEGHILETGQVIGAVDSITLVIQKGEVLANIRSISVKKTSINAEESVMATEMKNLERERKRVILLIESEAATQKQLDDLEGGMAVLKSKMTAVKSQHEVINAQVASLYAKIELIDEQIYRCIIINPTKGLVLTKLARINELVAPGKPLYKIADMSRIYLKAYISEPQLATVKQGQEVTVVIDYKEGRKDFSGTLMWVSSESEFTPKIIQTREERVNLVYAIKIAVENDGYLKLGMPGEVKF